MADDFRDAEWGRERSISPISYSIPSQRCDVGRLKRFRSVTFHCDCEQLFINMESLSSPLRWGCMCVNVCGCTMGTTIQAVLGLFYLASMMRDARFSVPILWRTLHNWCNVSVWIATNLAGSKSNSFVATMGEDILRLGDGEGGRKIGVGSRLRGAKSLAWRSTFEYWMRRQVECASEEAGKRCRESDRI